MASGEDTALASAKEARVDAGAESRPEKARHAKAASTATASTALEVERLPLCDRPTTSWGLTMICGIAAGVKRIAKGQGKVTESKERGRGKPVQQ